MNNVYNVRYVSYSYDESDTTFADVYDFHIEGVKDMATAINAAECLAKEYHVRRSSPGQLDVCVHHIWHSTAGNDLIINWKGDTCPSA